MSVQETLDAVDAELSANLAMIITRQGAYYAENGRYWQGLDTHSAVPADRADVAPDLLASKPTDVAEFWPEETPATMKANCRIDTWTKATGDGYTVVLEVVAEGDLYRKEIDSAEGSGDWVNIGGV